MSIENVPAIFYVQWVKTIKAGPEELAMHLTRRFDAIDARLSALEAHPKPWVEDKSPAEVTSHQAAAFERKPGWYWVKWVASEHGLHETKKYWAQWIPAYWSSDGWHLTDTWQYSPPKIIGPRIKEPSE